MTILSSDIKFVKSAVMDDLPNGGGAPTGTTVPDGQSNAVFPDISELDRAGGRVSLRKLHVVVRTNNTETYLGANVIVAEPPSDPGVSVTLFSTKETFDERTAASARIESYLTSGPEWAGFLLENHVAGQRVVQIFQRTTEALPNIGETLVLVYNEALSTKKEQYVRVTATSSVERTYIDGNGKPYQARVVSAEISDALRYDFIGSSPNEFFRRDTLATKVRETSVADAGMYSGVSKTTAAVEIGDLAATVQSVFTQLVPSAQTEIPLADLTPAGTSAAVTPAADGTVSYTTVQPLNSTTVLALSNPATPGTLVITAGSASLTDSNGQLYDGSTVIGTVDYARGTVSFTGASAPYTGSKTVVFKPAAAPQRVGDTAQIPVTPESRSYNYIVSIDPTPSPGSVMVSYRSNGRWYDLRDTGGGTLKGSDSSYGVGSVNYASGNVAVTLGALPDAGSSVLFSWNNQVGYINRSALAVPGPEVIVALPNAPIIPGAVDISWNDGTARTASDDGAGKITGAATGSVDYETGVVKFSPTLLPAGAQEYDVTYTSVGEASLKTHSESGIPRNSDTTITLNLGQTNVRPGTVKLTWDLETNFPDEYVGGELLQTQVSPTTSAQDNGAGRMITPSGRDAGSINYTTGIVIFQPDGPLVARKAHYVFNGSPAMAYAASAG